MAKTCRTACWKPTTSWSRWRAGSWARTGCPSTWRAPTRAASSACWCRSRGAGAAGTSVRVPAHDLVEEGVQQGLEIIGVERDAVAEVDLQQRAVRVVAGRAVGRH